MGFTFRVQPLAHGGKGILELHVAWLWSRVQGLGTGFRVQGSGFRVSSQALGCRVRQWCVSIQGSESQVMV